MRYRVVFYPMLEETLAVVRTSFDTAFDREARYDRTLMLKTKGDSWKLPDLLRELSDQLELPET
jgi:hypothetical protein